MDGDAANGDAVGSSGVQTTSAMSFSDMVGIESTSNASVRSSGSSANSGTSGGGGTFASAK